MGPKTMAQPNHFTVVTVLSNSVEKRFNGSYRRSALLSEMSLRNKLFVLQHIWQFGNIYAEAIL